MRLSQSLAHEGAIGHVERLFLTADGRLGEVDREIDLEIVGGLEPGHRLALAHFDRLEDADRPHRLGLLADAAGEEGLDEGHRRAVEDRNLGAVDLDQRIVNAAAGEGRHHMLDGRDRHARGICDQGAEARGHHRIPARRDQRVARGHVHAAEPDAVIGGGGLDDHADRLAGMEPDAGEFRCGFQSALHGLVLSGLWSGSRRRLLSVLPS